MLKGYSQVTGVVEKVEPDKTVRAALEINPGIKEIHVIFDNTESGLSTGEMTIQSIQRINPNIKIKTSNNKRLENILEDVRKASEESIILITTYYADIEGKVTGFEDFCKMISDNTDVPIYHLYDFGLGYGAIGGSMLSGRLQGEAAGRMACRVLEGENIEEISVSIDQTTRYIFDYNQLARFKVPKDSISEEWEIINKPQNYHTSCDSSAPSPFFFLHLSLYCP